MLLDTLLIAGQYLHVCVCTMPHSFDGSGADQLAIVIDIELNMAAARQSGKEVTREQLLQS